jgi:hypothetical protein
MMSGRFLQDEIKCHVSQYKCCDGKEYMAQDIGSQMIPTKYVAFESQFDFERYQIIVRESFKIIFNLISNL